MWVPGPDRNRAGELGRGALAEDHCAREPQERHDGRVVHRPVVLIDWRAVGGRHVVGVEDVLDADRHAVQRTSRSFVVACAGLGERGVAVDKSPGTHL
jgi:hypothetical protein